MARYKVVITDREYESIDNEREILKKIYAEVFDYQYKDEENILKVARDADAIIVQYAAMPGSLIKELDNCKIIARYATGFDGIDLNAATDKGIYVCNVQDYCSEEVAVHGVALLLEMARRINKYNLWTHGGNWYGMPGRQYSLKKQTIGVISFGKIAKSFIDKVKPFCENIWVYDKFVDPEDIIEYGVVPKNFEEIVKNADYISIHCPLTEETHHLFDKEVFRNMKNSAVVINAARGAVVSESDLIWALENKLIGGAALDVLENEPPKRDNPLFNFENVIITPHTAWYSEESLKILQSTPAEDIVRVLEGGIPLNIVNKEILNR